MATVLLTTHAVEEATFIVTASFKDEDGNAATPNEVKWTLTDQDGNVINSREDVVETPGTSVDIVLKGDDLALSAGETKGIRILTVNTKYDSALGSDLPLKASAKFIVDNLVAVT
jgi:uncharacterized protein YccT (UPF0319 family)